jgi:hypothetical protein
MSTKGNRQKVRIVLNLVSVVLSCHWSPCLTVSFSTFCRLPSVDIEVPVRQYRSQPSVGCPQLTLKSLLDSIVLNLLPVALKKVENDTF